MRRVLAALAVALFASAAQAQAPPVTSYQAPWSPVGALVTLSVTSASGNVQMGWATQSPLPSPQPTTAIVTNTGTTAAYCTAGGSSVVATTTGSASQPVSYVPVGAARSLALNGNQYIACITASSPTNVTIEAGNGSASNDASPGSGSAGGMAVDGSNAITPNSANNILAAGITSTTLPTQAAGTLGIGGQTLTPTLTANGEGDIYNNNTNNGITLIGKGSVSDFQFLNSTGGIVCNNGTGAITFVCGNFNTGGFYKTAGTTLPTQAAGTLGIGGEATKPTLGANGEGDIYLTSTTGGITLIGKGSANDLTVFNSGGTTVLTIPTGTTGVNFAGAITATLANTATTSAVCYNTSTGLFTYDSTIGTCNTSSRLVKHDILPLQETQPNALNAVMQMKPVSFYYNAEQNTSGQQLGLIAQDLATIDPRLVSYDEYSGEPNAIRFLGPLHAYEIAAIQQERQLEIKDIKDMKIEIERLRAEISRK